MSSILAIKTFVPASPFLPISKLLWENPMRIHLKLVLLVMGVVFAIVGSPAAFGQPAKPAAPPAQAAPQTAAPQEASTPDRDYILGPEDVVEVQVLGRTDFTTRARIGQDGTIQLPYLGTITATKMTTTQFSGQVSKALEAGGFFARPIVRVEIVSFASRTVTVLGAVGSPGLIPVDRPYRLSEIIARVGGVRSDGADYVVVRPENGPEKHQIIKDIATGDVTQDPYVVPGDKIFVPTAELFYISGEVKSPGAYPMISGMTLRMALARGGGVTDQGSDGRIKITRGGKAQRLSLDTRIEAGDVIVVGERLF
jgi:polysaccharide export outer membrane protein